MLETSFNRLADETSPYLLQHKDNPVHWQPWGAEALARARAEDKPILLSVGYAACHWCHVMAHESFEDDAIALVMNTLFVNIKVDREERPDLDVIYQTALGLLGEHGGWPLTMFLTPAGEPFWGGTYFPATARYGRPAFTDVLKGIAETYRTQNDRVLHTVGALKDAMNQLAQPAPAGGFGPDTLERTAALIAGTIDRIHGGTSGAPKFPQPSLFRFLWRTSRRTGDSRCAEAVTVTLDRICQGGIYDHLGGGFARYSTDAMWLAPHFEKMLYDNALLVDLLSEVWLQTRSPLYAVRVAETIDWVLREMQSEGAEGAFASAYDADSDGEEGRFYVWSEAEIDRLLGPDAAVFKQAYDVTPGGNWEGKTILNRTHAPDLGTADDEGLLARCRETLRPVRAERTWPLWDDKVLADWNGLMIAAMANAASVFDRSDWLAAARGAFDFICRRMMKNGRLLHSWRAGQTRHTAVLDDYANMSAAAMALYEATGETPFLDQAEAWVDTVNSRYWDSESGGYFLTADDTNDVILRPKTIADNATPSGNGTMAHVLARLFYLTGATSYRDRAETLIALFSGDEPRRLTNQPSLLDGFALLEGAVQIVIAGDADDPATRALIKAAHDAALPDRVIVRLNPGAALPDGHPAAGKGPVDGRPAAYVCAGAVCGLPLTDPEALRDDLGKRVGRAP